MIAVVDDLELEEGEGETEELSPVLELPTMVVKPTSGPLKGRTLKMRLPSARFWIARERGELTNALFLAEILESIEEHDLGRDPFTMPPAYVDALARAWIRALSDLALPPDNGSD